MTRIIEKKHQIAKQQFIKALQELLLFDRWSLKLLEDTSLHCGFVKDYHYILFPDGIREVMTLFEQYHDQQMMRFEAQEGGQLRVREKIAILLSTRIKNMQKLVHIKNNAYFILPENMLFAIKLAWNSCDIIWHYVGDTSIDFNYYTKRGLLVSVYLSSILFYISDESENSIDTDEFIKNSLENVINIAKLKKLCRLPELSSIPILRLFS